VSEIVEQKQGFSLQPQNMQQAMELAQTISNSDMVPKDFKGKAGNTMVAMMLGSELGLNPIQALQNISVINGRPAIWGDAMLALVQNNPNFVSIKETFDETTMTAACIITRKGSEPHTERFSKADAEMAGLWGKQGPWKQYPKRMLALRARGFALRNQFADALSGLVSVEEARDINVVDITDTATVETVKEPEVMPTYPDDKFAEKFPAFEAAIISGKKTHSDIINMIQTKFTLTEGMIQSINSVEVAA